MEYSAGLNIACFLCKVNFIFIKTYDTILLRKVDFTFKRSMAMKNRLGEIRKQRGINQEELATALEVSRQTIGSLENGRYNPSILLAFKIARYFNMTIEDIFIYEEE